MRKRFLHAALLSLFVAAAMYGQSNDAMDRLLGEDQATIGDASYIILGAAGLVGDDATTDQVMAVVADKNLLPQDRTADKAITLGEVSYLIMKTQDLRGGLLYLAFPGPRYAARQLAYLGLISGNTHPSRVVSGQEVVRILDAALYKKGANQ